ncbi:MAG TPA: site-2 protease family protein [Chitinophagaceae bacterium]|nr:site-2 protease family protein [Chitinophagaceae bacterium]
MDASQDQYPQQPGLDNDPSAGDQPAGDTSEFNSFPPKPFLEENKNKTNVWLKSISSLALYLVIGYLFFNRDWLLVLVLTGVVVFHEMGHFLAMKLYRYKELGIFFIPLLGAYASGSKHEVSQKQSAVIILAGPVPGIVLGVLFYFISLHSGSYMLERVAWILIFLNLLNLLPVYPLDGGQLLNRLFLNESQLIASIFIIVSCAAMAWFAWSIRFYPLLLFPAMILFRMFGDLQQEKLIKKIEAEGVDLNTSYEDITDEQYWTIRQALIKHHPDLKDIPSAPPYSYADREDKVIMTMQSLLQRTLVMDLSIAGKLLILLIWIACFVLPFFLELPLRVF